MNRLTPANRYIFKSNYYLWVVLIEHEDDSLVRLQVERHLTGKRKGRRLATCLDMYGIDHEEPYGQWIRALMTSGDIDEFTKWIQAFHKTRPTKTALIDFEDHRVICNPGNWNGPVNVARHNDTETELISCPP